MKLPNDLEEKLKLEQKYTSDSDKEKLTEMIRNKVSNTNK